MPEILLSDNMSSTLKLLNSFSANKTFFFLIQVNWCGLGKKYIVVSRTALQIQFVGIDTVVAYVLFQQILPPDCHW